MDALTGLIGFAVVVAAAVWAYRRWVRDGDDSPDWVVSSESEWYED